MLLYLCRYKCSELPVILQLSGEGGREGKGGKGREGKGREGREG